MKDHYEQELEDNLTLQTRTAKLNRNRAAGHNRLYNDYFASNYVYNKDDFERRYRFFQTRYDARGRRGFTTLQKYTAAIRAMAYGNSPDSLDDYLRMFKRTAREIMNKFAVGVVELFGSIYLRKLNVDDVQNLFAAHEERHGFPGMLGSLDCTHCDWRNCPQEWRGMYTNGFYGVPSLLLKAIAFQDTWIWHAFFGTPGSQNDVNGLDGSPLFNDMLSGKFHDAHFSVNDHNYRYGYYLADGIYHRHATFVKAYKHPTSKREHFFAKRQEAARKDVEHAFVILKAKWHVVDQAARPYTLEVLRPIMYACIIMLNKIIEEKNRHISPYVANAPQQALYIPGTPEYLQMIVQIQSNDTHARFKDDLARYFYNNAHPEDNKAVSYMEEFSD